MPFTEMDWPGIQDAMVTIENAALPAVVTALIADNLYPVGTTFNALKYQPSRLTGYPRSFRLGHGRTNNRRAAGGGVTGGTYNEDCWIQIGIAVGAATEPRSTAQPKAEAMDDAIVDAYRAHNSIGNTVDFILADGGIRTEIGDFQPPAQDHYGVLVTLYFRKEIERDTAP